MNTFKSSVQQSFKGALKTLETFPIVIISAMAFAIVTMIRIQMDWPEQEDYNFLFNCLHLAFSASAAFGLMAITFAQSRYNNAKAFWAANLLGLFVAIIAFVSLYYFGGAGEDVVTRVSGIAAARITAVIMVSLIAFIFFSGYPKEESDFARALFMFHKAFFIAVIYGAVIMSGVSGIAGAVQALLYKDMSYKVYMYLGTITGFLAFAIFVGYFPDFRKGQLDKYREVVQKQPRFIEILFEYIMVPIMLVLTVVLLTWVGKIIVTGDWPDFGRLSGIVTSYSIGGIWLHFMVTRSDSGLAKFYRKIYPVLLLVILAFGLWGFAVQLNEAGLKELEYCFALVATIAVASGGLLLLRKSTAHPTIVALACGVIVFSVLPLVGYHSMPVRTQVERLENLLTDQGILVENKLIPASAEPDREIRESITDAVQYLAYAEGARLPEWFDERLAESDVFKRELGFEKTWPEPEDYEDRYNERLGMFLELSNEAVDISGYDWAIHLNEFRGEGVGEAMTSVDGENGSYTIDWMKDFRTGIPTLKILLDDKVILERNMKEYISETVEKFQDENKDMTQDVEEMSLIIETPEVSVLLIFDYIGADIDPEKDIIYYNLDLNVLYMREN